MLISSSGHFQFECIDKVLNDDYRLMHQKIVVLFSTNKEIHISN